MTPIFISGAFAIGRRTRRDGELLNGCCIAEVRIIFELVVAADFLKRGDLITDIEACCHRNSIDALPSTFAVAVEHIVVRFQGQPEEVDAGVEFASPQVGVLNIAERDDTAVQQRQLHVALQEVEVQDVDATDWQRIIKRRIDVGPHCEGTG